MPFDIILSVLKTYLLQFCKEVCVYPRICFMIAVYPITGLLN